MTREEIEQLIIEIETYRNLEGKPFDFGTGLIENNLSFGTEEAYWEMEIQELEELLLDYDYPVNTDYKKRKKKNKLNKYKRKKITNRKLEKLYYNRIKPDYRYYQNRLLIYYSDEKQRLIKYYLSGRKKFAKRCTNKKVRIVGNNDLKMRKSCHYRKIYGYWNTVF